jgi:Arc/MetJ family transcription regulator
LDVYQLNEVGSTMGRFKHTSLNIDVELLEAAERALGTSQMSETIHRALQEAVNLARRRQLLELDLPGLTPERVEEMRQNRRFDIHDSGSP